jgi:hypothetical protein
MDKSNKEGPVLTGTSDETVRLEKNRILKFKCSVCNENVARDFMQEHGSKHVGVRAKMVS